MCVLQQTSKNDLCRLKSELESDKETLKKERNSIVAERLQVINQGKSERKRLQKDRNEFEALQIEHVGQKGELRNEQDK